MRQGDPEAATQAYEEAYQELRTIARRLVRHEYASNVAATELVNETYLRHLHRGTIVVENRQQFYSIAALAMRHVLIDLARQRQAACRGRGSQVLPIESATAVAALASTPEEILSLDAHLKRLEKLDPGAAKVFSMRYFLGHTAAEVADLLVKDVAEIRKDWEYAKAWLRDRINQDLIHSAKRSAK
jgi:RNA polymerase sigma factor (TIGR02999 family)